MIENKKLTRIEQWTEMQVETIKEYLQIYNIHLQQAYNTNAARILKEFNNHNNNQNKVD